MPQHPPEGLLPRPSLLEPEVEVVRLVLLLVQVLCLGLSQRNFSWWELRPPKKLFTPHPSLSWETPPSVISIKKQTPPSPGASDSPSPPLIRKK